MHIFLCSKFEELSIQFDDRKQKLTVRKGNLLVNQDKLLLEPLLERHMIISTSPYRPLIRASLGVGSKFPPGSTKNLPT